MAQNLGRLSKGVGEYGLKTSQKWVTKNGQLLVKILLKFELINPFHARFSDIFRGYRKRPVVWNRLRLIWGHLDSFQLIYRLTHLSSFRPILSSYRIFFNIFRVFWARSGSFRPILVCLGSFRLICSHLDLLELIKAQLSSFRLIQAFLSLFTLIWACTSSIRAIQVHFNSLRLIQTHLSSFRLIRAYLGSFGLH